MHWDGVRVRGGEEGWVGYREGLWKGGFFLSGLRANYQNYTKPSIFSQF